MLGGQYLQPENQYLFLFYFLYNLALLYIARHVNKLFDLNFIKHCRLKKLNLISKPLGS